MPWWAAVERKEKKREGSVVVGCSLQFPVSDEEKRERIKKEKRKTSSGKGGRENSLRQLLSSLGSFFSFLFSSSLLLCLTSFDKTETAQGGKKRRGRGGRERKRKREREEKRKGRSERHQRRRSREG